MYVPINLLNAEIVWTIVYYNFAYLRFAFRMLYNLLMMSQLPINVQRKCVLHTHDYMLHTNDYLLHTNDSTICSPLSTDASMPHLSIHKWTDECAENCRTGPSFRSNGFISPLSIMAKFSHFISYIIANPLYILSTKSLISSSSRYEKPKISTNRSQNNHLGIILNTDIMQNFTTYHPKAATNKEVTYRDSSYTNLQHLLNLQLNFYMPYKPLFMRDGNEEDPPSNHSLRNCGFMGLTQENIMGRKQISRTTQHSQFYWDNNNVSSLIPTFCCMLHTYDSTNDELTSNRRKDG